MSPIRDKLLCDAHSEADPPRCSAYGPLTAAPLWWVLEARYGSQQFHCRRRWPRSIDFAAVSAVRGELL